MLCESTKFSMGQCLTVFHQITLQNIHIGALKLHVDTTSRNISKNVSTK
jgi:hypothetical protein